jgi:PAS domain S-box-containing protein
MTSTTMPPTILVVDDDAGLLVLIEGALRAEKWNVATAASGADALAWLHKHSADLLLLDLKLSDIEGREFIGALADAGRLVPFIIITGQGDERVAVEMMKRGALDYLVKDVNFVGFVPAVVRRGLAQLERERRLVEAEKSLREERDFVSAVLQTAGALVVVLDEAGRVVRFNRACEQVTGYAADEIVGKAIWDLLLPPEEVIVVRTVFEQLQAGQLPSRFENCWLTKAGQRRLISWANTVLTNSDGTVKHIIGTGLDITERKRLENQILEISEREQRRFGHDLHDGLGQRLTGLEMLSHALAEDLNDHASALAKQARRLNRELRETVTQARLISHSLAPVPLEGEGLMHGLMELAASTNRIPGVACRFTCDPPVCIQDVTTATHLYRMAQEAVNNALKHGRAREVNITLKEQADGLELRVENNGRAIPPADPAGGGMGLNVMRYRAGVIGASLAIESGKRKGVRVTCTWRRRI